MKNNNNAVGTYTTEAATAIRNMIGAGTYSKPAGGIPAADLAETYLTSH
jgi:deoxyribose-phosphate aldolase